MSGANGRLRKVATSCFSSALPRAEPAFCFVAGLLHAYFRAARIPIWLELSDNREARGEARKRGGVFSCAVACALLEAARWAIRGLTLKALRRGRR